MNTSRRNLLKMITFTGTGLIISPKLISCVSENKKVFKPLFGVCTRLENAEMLASHGFDYVEEGVRHFLIPDQDEETFRANLEVAKKTPIPAIACNGFIPGEMKSVGPDTVHPEILEYARTAFRRAQQAGIKYIVFGSGGSRKIPDDFSREEALGQFISLLKQMAPIAGEYDVTIVLEPLRSGETNFINTVAEGGDIVRKVNHPNFQLLADIYHMLMENEGPESLINNADIIKHMHIAEKEGRSAPGTHGEDFTPYFEALRTIGYSGGISIEGRWEDMKTQAPLAIETLKRQMGFVT